MTFDVKNIKPHNCFSNIMRNCWDEIYLPFRFRRRIFASILSLLIRKTFSPLAFLNVTSLDWIDATSLSVKEWYPCITLDWRSEIYYEIFLKILNVWILEIPTDMNASRFSANVIAWFYVYVILTQKMQAVVEGKNFSCN